MRRRSPGRSPRRIFNDFIGTRATSPDCAIAYVAKDARIFRHPRVRGAIDDDGAGRYHLDTRRLGAFRTAVCPRAAAIVGVSGVAASIAANATVFTLAE